MHDRPVPARWLRWTLAATAAVLACVGYGVSTASADLSLGPHEAIYEVTNDGLVVADLGPLGTLEIDSPLPLGLGVDIIVKEIPADLRMVDAASTLDALVGDVDAYLQFWDNPNVTISAVTSALVADALRRAGLALLGTAAVGAVAYLLLGAARRRELTARLAPRTWQITAGVVVVGMVSTFVAASDAGLVRSGRPASPVFEGTALEGARITGRLAGVIDTYGGELISLYEQNEEFYEDARVDLVAAWRAWEVRHAVRVASGSVPTDDPDFVTMLVVADLHCNTGMTPLIREAAERSQADVILNAGDTTMNGTAVESVCVDSFATAVPDGVDMVVADGNHDSVLTSQQELAHGQIVLDGGVVEVAGVRILGDRDALETRVGAGTQVAREQTPAEQAAALAATACDDGDVDLLLLHTPVVGREALYSGCVPFQVSGHTHRRTGPAQVGQGILFVSGSTAGALSGQPTVGPLRGPAEMSLLRFDPESRQVVDVQVIEIQASGRATVFDRQPVPPVLPPLGVPHEPGLEPEQTNGDQPLGPGDLTNGEDTENGTQDDDAIDEDGADEDGDDATDDGPDDPGSS